MKRRKGGEAIREEQKKEARGKTWEVKEKVTEENGARVTEEILSSKREK